MPIQLYAQYPETTTWTLLDLFGTDPIKLNFSVSNIIDPLQVNSTFSRTFRVPHTSINGPFFRAVFNVNSLSFDASKKAAAYINDNGAYFAIGNIRLASVYRNELGGDIQYEIIFYGETSDFGSKIGGGFLSEVDLSAYNHFLNYSNITASWTNGLFGGDIVYPLCEWGYEYDAGVPQQTTLAVGGAQGFVGAAAQTLAQEQFKPAIRAKSLWDAIFDETGYTYSSTFLEGTEFGNLYVLTDSRARALLSVDNTFEAAGAITVTQTGTPVQITAGTSYSDPGNNWNVLTGLYTAKSTGSYTFTVETGIWIDDVGPLTWYYAISIQDSVTSTILTSTGLQPAAGGFGVTPVHTLTASLTAGQKIKFVFDPTAPPATTTVEILYPEVACTVAPEEISMASLMPNNIRKIDFMRSIINKFKLVFVPDKIKPRHFEITPWKDWILGGVNRDWTEKLDGGKDMKITPLFYGQERFQVFRDSEDGDFVNLNYGLVTKQVYGQLNLDSENELITGSKETVTSFAPTPLLPIGNSNPQANPVSQPYAYYASRFLIPHLAKDTNTERTPIQPKLRLLFYNGLVNVPHSSQNWKLFNDGNVAQTQTSYPLMSQYSVWPPTTSSFDINWENEAPLYETEYSLNPGGRTAYDTFNVYWKTWYDTTFDPYSRIVEATFVLDYSDVYDLAFNDYIFVIDAWYLVNKITDYVAGAKTSVRVELIKVGNNIGLVIPPSEVQYQEVTLCLGVSACEAFCCNGITAPALYYVDGTSLLDSNFIWIDPYGSLPVNDGIYSDGTTTVGTSFGVINVVYDTSACECEPEAVYEFIVCYADEEEGLCVACCCSGDTITVYGTDPTLINNVYLYTDAGLTSPAPAGNYYDSSLSSNPYTAQVENLGQVVAVGVCTFCECNPPVVYLLEAEFFSIEIDPVTACTGVGAEVVVYGDASTWDTSTQTYQDNGGLTPGAEGYYYDPISGDVYEVDASGAIVSVTACP